MKSNFENTHSDSSYKLSLEKAFETASTEEPDEQSWLLTYVDTITLILCFFVMMFAMSKFDVENYQRLLKKKQQELEVAQSAIKQTPQEIAHAEISVSIEEMGLDNLLGVHIVDDHIQLQISDDVLFSSGQAYLKESGEEFLDALLPILSSFGQTISVEGHTDSLPIANDVYQSNWELSSSRASAVVHYLVEIGIPADRLKVVGYGSTRPIASNDSQEGRSQNRRVDFKLDIPDKTRLSKPIDN